MTRLAAMVSVLALTWAGCTARLSAPLSPPPVTIVRQAPADEPAPAPVEMVSGSQVIEAGCSFSATDIKGGPGSTHRIACPAGCRDTGATWGTDVYTADSPICRAAIHAGHIREHGGEVTVILEPGRPAYRGSARNGVQSSDYGSYRGSYRFEGPVIAAPPPPPVTAQLIEAGCSFDANQIKGDPGSMHRISCPADCRNTGSTWGTDVYTADSTICRAAIHAGLVTDRGGEVTVILEPGRPAYRGTARNGIRSSDYGSYRASYRFSR